MHKIFALLAVFVPVILAACGGAATTNSNANTNTNSGPTMVTLDNANLPAGLSASPLPITNAQTPGIPANVNVIQKGTTPTPGIPSEAEIKRGIKRGATPTPGIPSPEEMRRQMNTPAGNMGGAAAASDPRPTKSTNRRP